MHPQKIAICGGSLRHADRFKVQLRKRSAMELSRYLGARVAARYMLTICQGILTATQIQRIRRGDSQILTYPRCLCWAVGIGTCCLRVNLIRFGDGVQCAFIPNILEERLAPNLLPPSCRNDLHRKLQQRQWDHGHHCSIRQLFLIRRDKSAAVPPCQVFAKER
jgi:hypothetical protein